jgi:hypothetical protein
MSDLSQGVGWWLASDGKWYPPQSVPVPIPPPPPNAYPEQIPSGNAPKKSRKGLVAALVVLLVVVGLGVGIAVAASKNKAASPVASPAPALSQADIAGTAYGDAFNKMNTVANAQTAAQNGTDPAATAAAWNAEVAARQAFDTAVGQLNFPDADRADAKQVIQADAALESAEGTLAANTNDVSNYNSVFSTVSTAENAFAAADKTLSNDFGLVTK